MFITKNILNGASPDVNAELQALMRLCKAIVDHSPELVKLLKSRQCKAIQTAMANLMQGMRNARSGNAHVLKIRASNLAREKSTDLTIDLMPQGKVNRGFNHPVLSQMILPIDYLKDFDRNPTSIQVKINGGDKAYPVMADLSLSFLYEDPNEYDPKDVYIGYMQGYYLTHIMLLSDIHIAKYGDGGTDHKEQDDEKRDSQAIQHNLYQTRDDSICRSSEANWSVMDSLFDYKVFFNMIIEIFDQDEDWKQDTIQWWNMEVFGNKNGFKVMKISTGPTINGALAKAKMQAAKCQAAKLSARTNAIEPTEAHLPTPPSAQGPFHPSHVPGDDCGDEDEGRDEDEQDRAEPSCGKCNSSETSTEEGEYDHSDEDRAGPSHGKHNSKGTSDKEDNLHIYTSEALCQNRAKWTRPT
ncbi:hypothetical protein EI94DRAFT_1705017 [Lactarius quietus]|nr:hypothetical protein EI94DRAFT_1705017 [Lactarius quietus]